MSEADSFEYDFIGIHKDAITCMSLFNGYLKFIFESPEAPLKLRPEDCTFLAIVNPSK